MQSKLLYCTSNKGFLEECHKQEHVAVTGLLLFPVCKENCKTFCPISNYQLNAHFLTIIIMFVKG